MAIAAPAATGKHSCIGFIDDDDFNSLPRMRAELANHQLILGSIHDLTTGTGGLGTLFRTMEKSLHHPGLVCCGDTRSALERDNPGSVFCLPLSEEDRRLFQLKYGKSYLWPLLHGLAPHISTPEINMARRRAINVARRFARFTSQRTSHEQPSIFWMHDYPLVLTLPFLRAFVPHGKICFSLHSPFGGSAGSKPAFLPADDALFVRSLLAADFLSFLRQRDLDNFLRAADDLISRSPAAGIAREGDSFTIQNRRVHARVVPMGSNPPYRQLQARSIEAEDVLRHFHAIANGRKVVLSVSRLEPHKGIEEELLAFGALLDRYPSLAEKAVLFRVMPITPLYATLPTYRDLLNRVLQLAEAINARHGNADVQPVQLLTDRPLTDCELAGLYRLADAWVVMSIADGFNVSALEGPLSKTEVDSPASLLLSDVGASDFLRPYFTPIDPRNPAGAAELLASALQRPAEQTAAIQQDLVRSARCLSAERWGWSVLAATLNIHAVPAWAGPLSPSEHTP